MASPTVAPGRTVWSTAARAGAWVLLIALLTALGLLVYLWPWLLVCIAAGAALGSLPWLFRRFGALRASLTVAFGLFVIAVFGSLLGGGAQHAVEPGLRPGVQPATYAADLQFVAAGDWSGLEQFDLTREQAIAFAGRGRGLKQRLAGAVPKAGRSGRSEQAAIGWSIPSSRRRSPSRRASH